MFQRQGRPISKERVARIQRLLMETDMTICEIAESASCSKSVIWSINQKFGIRNYTGRSYWLVDQNWKTKSTERNETSEITGLEGLVRKAS